MHSLYLQARCYSLYLSHALPRISATHAFLVSTTSALRRNILLSLSSCSASYQRDPCIPCLQARCYSLYLSHALPCISATPAFLVSTTSALRRTIAKAKQLTTVAIFAGPTPSLPLLVFNLAVVTSFMLIVDHMWEALPNTLIFIRVCCLLVGSRVNTYTDAAQNYSLTRTRCFSFYPRQTGGFVLERF